MPSDTSAACCLSGIWRLGHPPQALSAEARAEKRAELDAHPVNEIATVGMGAEELVELLCEGVEKVRRRCSASRLPSQICSQLHAHLIYLTGHLCQPLPRPFMPVLRERADRACSTSAPSTAGLRSRCWVLW